MFVEYRMSGGHEYARAVTAIREQGDKKNECVHNLGRVIDKEAGIFRNRERGTFRFTLQEGFSEAPQEVDGKEEIRPRQVLDFGGEFIFIKALEDSGLAEIFRGTLPQRADTLMSMVLYKILRHGSGVYAKAFWEGSYARIAFPEAKLRSQRLSEFMEELGDEEIVRGFFQAYLTHISKGDGKRNRSILVDSTGLPNDIHLPITAVNTHNGVTSNEIRLVLVVDRVTGLPLFFRYVAGNIVDVSTLKNTIAEVSQYGVTVEHCIVDAGYYCEKNIREMADLKISFITRLKANTNLYKDLADKYVPGLDVVENVVRYGERIIFMKRVKVRLFGEVDGYAYIGIDYEMQCAERRSIYGKMKGDDLTDRKKALQECGVFMLISNSLVGTSEILPLYYTRQTVEQVFDIGKNYAELLPLRTHKEETFRGHLMLSFMATAAILRMNRLLKKSGLNALMAIANLHNVKCLVFNDKLITTEPNKKANDILKALRIKIDTEIAL
jgi:hypothetical protein